MIAKIPPPLYADQGIVRLIERYKHFAFEKARDAEQRAEELKVKLPRFWRQFENAKAVYADRERTEAPRFNLVRLLELERLERNHSRILADLLNPRGTHGQRTLFLESFFDLIGLAHIKVKVLSFAARVEVCSALAITGESRPDIVIRCIPWVVVVIENKIRSGEGRTHPDGSWQLEKYRRWLEYQTVDEKRLLFLTIYGERSESGGEDCRISYIRDIGPWLVGCLKNVAAPGVQHALRQYLETIEDLRSLRKENSNGDK